MDDPDNVKEEEIVSTCRLFLSNVRGLRRTVAAKEEELDGCCCSSSSGEVVNDDKSTAVSNQTIHKEDKFQLKQDLKEWFQQYGDVVEVFLPDRVAVTTKSSSSSSSNKKKKKKKKQQPYAFVTMATPESAQLAISDNKNNRENSHRTETEECNTNTSKSTRNMIDKQQQQQGIRIRINKCPLFDDCVPAPPTIRNKRQQKKVKSENQNHALVQKLLQTSNILCQLSKSHLQRFQDYVLLYSEQQQPSKEEINSNRVSSEVHGHVIGWIKTDSKTMVLVFLYSTQPKQFLSDCILKDWFVRPIIHRTMIIQQSQIFPLSCPPEEDENEKESALFADKLLDGIKLGIRNTFKSHNDTAGSLTATTTCANRGGSCSGNMAAPQQQSNQPPLRVRLQLFPPRLLQPLLERLQNKSYHGNDRQWEVFSNNCVEFTPTNATHTLTIIRISETAFAMGGLEKNVVGNNPIPATNGYERQKEGKNSQVLSGNSNTTKNRKTKKDGNCTAICRAHWKLQEAFERYRYELPLDPLNALDCGSAPGGWTRCLDDIFSKSCQRIYSVDPGEMDDSVLQIPTVQHIPMTIQNAFTWLSKQQQQQCNARSNLLLQEIDEANMSNSDTHISSSSLTINQSNNPVPDCQCPIIDIWVSDMCVKDMEQQVTLFLQARELGIVGSGTFFVLTLKCIVGYSDATFDLLCQKQVQGRLQPVCRNLHQLHLFTNRISERTVMGYLK